MPTVPFSGESSGFAETGIIFLTGNSSEFSVLTSPSQLPTWICKWKSDQNWMHSYADHTLKLPSADRFGCGKTIRPGFHVGMLGFLAVWERSFFSVGTSTKRVCQSWWNIMSLAKRKIFMELLRVSPLSMKTSATLGRNSFLWMVLFYILITQLIPEEKTRP